MISDVNELIKEYFQSTLGSGISANLDFSSLTPTKKFSESLQLDTVNIYLLDVRENVQLRQNQWQRSYTEGGDIEEEAPPIMLDLYYVITVYSKKNNSDEEHEHKLFENVLYNMYRFSSFYEEHLSDDSKEIAKQISLELFPQKYIEEHLGLQLWSALDQNVRPLISLKITAPLNVEHKVNMTKVQTKEIDLEFKN